MCFFHLLTSVQPFNAMYHSHQTVAQLCSLCLSGAISADDSPRNTLSSRSPTIGRQASAIHHQKYGPILNHDNYDRSSVRLLAVDHKHVWLSVMVKMTWHDRFRCTGKGFMYMISCINRETGRKVSIWPWLLNILIELCLWLYTWSFCQYFFMPMFLILEWTFHHCALKLIKISYSTSKSRW